MFKLVVDKSRLKPKQFGPWTVGDIEFLDNPKGRAKLHQKMNALPYNLNYRLAMGDMTKLREKANEAIEILPDFINVSMLNNVTTVKNWIPPTAWILCHRLAHMLYQQPDHENADNLPWTEDFASTDGPEWALWYGLVKIWNYVYGFGAIDQQKIKDSEKFAASKRHWTIMNPVLPNVMDKWAGMLIMSLFTMRSARERIMGSELDVFAEALAQHMITGRFKMNRWEDTDLPALKNWNDWTANDDISTYGQGRAWGNQTMLWKPYDLGVVNEMISNLEQEVNDKIATLLIHCKGKHLVF